MLKSILLFCALATTPAFAATYKVPEAEPLLTIEIPAKWQTKKLGECFQATAPRDPMHVLVVPPEGTKIAETMGEVMRYIRNSGGIVVKPDSVKQELGKLNDMDMRKVSWQGKDKNGEIKIQFTILSLAPRKPMLIAVWGSPKTEEKHEAELKKILESIKGVAEKDH